MTTKTLAGTTPEDRANLLRFGPAKPGVCSVITDPACTRPAPWFVVCEDAYSGVTTFGRFEPMRVGAHVCVHHLAQLEAEPRRIHHLEVAKVRKATIPVRIVELPGVSRQLRIDLDRLADRVRELELRHDREDERAQEMAEYDE